MIDSHCHLHHIKESSHTVLQRAKQAGLEAVVQAANDAESSKWALENLKNFPLPVWPSTGLYPSNAKDDWQNLLSEIRELATDSRIVAIGECGLDRYWDDSYIDRQKDLLRAQIELALDQRLPLILHCRNAYQDLEEVLVPYQSDPHFRGVWHCFDGNLQQAETMISFGLMISISGIITYKKNTELQDTVRQLPIDRLLVETDSPYLSPIPLRGKPNEPANVTHTSHYVAGLIGLDPTTASLTFTNNTKTLFRRGP